MCMIRSKIRVLDLFDISCDNDNELLQGCKSISQMEKRVKKFEDDI